MLVILFLTACGNGGRDSDDSDGDGSLGGAGGLGGGSGSSGDAAIDSDAVLDSAMQSVALSDEDLSAAIAAADLDLQMALAQKSGLRTELGGDEATRAMLAAIGFDMELAAELFAAGALFDGQDPQSAQKKPLFDMKKPGARVQADDGGSLGEAFGAGWLGGSLFNGAFVDLVVRGYSEGKSGVESQVSEEITATAGLSDTLVTIDATAIFKLQSLSSTIKTHSGIPCPDANGLVTVNSSLDITAQAGNAYQNVGFRFELIAEVDDDAKLTGKNQLTSRTQNHTADSSQGYDTTDGTVDISITEFSDGKFGDAKGSYQGMTEKEMLGWMGMGMLSGELYRRQLLPHLQTMLEAGRCVNITVEPSAGPLNLDPFTNVDLLTKPRAKIDSKAAHGTVQASFKKNAGGSILESGEKVKADATFHYLSPSEHEQTEVVTFQARSKRGTGKLDYTLTTSPHAD